MALTDDHPIKVVSPEYKPAGQGDLESWLGKEAEKKNEAGRLETNADESTVYYSDLYDNPAGRKDGGNNDSRWGEGPNKEKGKQAPFHNNAATTTAADKERHEVASRAFATLPAASAVAKALLAKNLAHAASGDYESHSVMLHKTKQASLLDRVKNLVKSI
jgi:hypothetical protein